MHRALLALLASAWLALPLTAGELRNFGDAPLHAVQFVDQHEGWAVGDEGVVWHTIDGGQTWERQPTATRASLRSLCFLDPFTGYVVGRETLPYGAGSAGVILFTRDGGLTWKRISSKTLPGLQQIKFVDHRTAFVVGEASDQFPSGIFVTEDGGANWSPVAAKPGPGWCAADFLDSQNGVVAGPWGSLAPMRQRELLAAEIDSLHGRTLRGVQLVGRTAWAVGDGGTVLVSRETVGKRWGHAEVKLPASIQNCWDFHALHFVGNSGWIVGRPGSAVLHTWDGGKSWQAQNTGQPLPLNGVFFFDEKRGWAVGELGTILATTDGGKSWKVQRRGGHRAAVLVVTASAEGLPVATVAQLGGDDGYLSAAVRVVASDPASAAPVQAGEGARFADAVRQAGGCGGEVLWQFPLPQHLARADATQLARHWGESQDEAKGFEELERQIVLALRIWRPDVVITDNADPRSATGQVGALIALAAGKAFRKAGQADAYPEQIAKLDLQPWTPSKLYGRWETAEGAHVTLDLGNLRPRLLASAVDFAAPASSIINDKPMSLAQQAHYRLLDSQLEDAEKHKDLMQGTQLEWGGQARREMPPIHEESIEQAVKATQQRRDFQAVAAQQVQEPAKAPQLVSALDKSLKGLDDAAAGDAAFALANLYVNAGQWPLAKETFLLMLERYPSHRQAPEACRWLIRYGSSSEARRREELGHFVSVGYFGLGSSAKPGAQASKKAKMWGQSKTVEYKPARAGQAFPEEVQNWYEGSLSLADYLADLGAVYLNQPEIQFCLQSAKRNLGDFDAARLWYTQFKVQQSAGPWCDAAGTELWLTSRTGQPSKPILQAVPVPKPPFLDGKLDDECWKDKPLTLQDAVAATVEEYPTEVWLAYDAEYLFLALRCQHPSNGHQVPPVKPRPRDADLRNFDRVSLMIDLDRDYSTCFQFQVDQRGCCCEDCWGDKNWNPKWLVAVHSDESSWQIEAAIPLNEVTGNPISGSQVWACNVVRTIPGRGVQAVSVPADVKPRPEGMGLLLFARPQGK